MIREIGRFSKPFAVPAIELSSLPGLESCCCPNFLGCLRPLRHCVSVYNTVKCHYYHPTLLPSNLYKYFTFVCMMSPIRLMLESSIEVYWVSSTVHSGMDVSDENMLQCRIPSDLWWLIDVALTHQSKLSHSKLTWVVALMSLAFDLVLFAGSAASLTELVKQKVLPSCINLLSGTI